MRERIVGKTKDAGYQIGVSRTLPLPVSDVWHFLTSPAGIALWLGEGAKLAPDKGAPYETADGTVGEIRSFHEQDRIRLTWRPVGADHESIVQVAVVSNGPKTVLTFHQERMTSPTERERQREHWKRLMDAVSQALGEPRE